MRITIVGPGRAGLSLAAAAQHADHDITALVGRDLAQAAAHADRFGAQPAAAGDDLPETDLVVIATRDVAIAPVADLVAPTVRTDLGAVHLSGLTPVAALAAFADRDVATGSFHPLQTLPTAEAGASRLAGAWIAVTAAAPFDGQLSDLATSLGAHPFALADEAKPLYHAAAAAAANLPLAALTMASDLFERAGVPFAAARPLVEAVVANAFDLGPRPALTGPVARGDVATVDAQLDAVAAAEPDWLPAFTAGVMQLAAITGRTEEFEDMLHRRQPGES